MNTARYGIILALGLMAGALLGQEPAGPVLDLPALPAPVETETLAAPTANAQRAIKRIGVPMVEGPTTKKRGEYVRLTVRFDEKASAAFMPVDTYDWGQDPIIEYDEDERPVLVGRVCSFSVPCDYPDDEIVVMCSWYATIGGRPDVQMVRHVIKVEGAMLPPPAPPTDPNGPDNPNDPPPVPPKNEPGGPVVPIPPITTTTRTAKQADDAVLEAIAALTKDIEEIKTKGVKQYSAPVIVPSPPITSRVVTSKPVQTSQRTVIDDGGGFVTINGLAYPPKSLVISHLRAPIHANDPNPWPTSQFEPFEQWTAGQLNTIHTRHHYGRPAPWSNTAMIGGSTISAPTISMPSYSMPSYSMPSYSMPSAGGSPCPNGVCPLQGSQPVRYGLFGLRRR